MDYRILGRSGVKVSTLGLGTDNFSNPTSQKESIQIIDRAIDAGINFIDTANTHADGDSERIIGKALKSNERQFWLELVQHLLVVAKEASLKRLQTDYIDLYQLHRPSFDIPLDETLGALSDLVTQGKVRYVGSSTSPAWKIMEALHISELRRYPYLISEQSPYNLLDRRIENELIPCCEHNNLALIAWSPLAMGLLAGRYENANKMPKGSRGHLRKGIYGERITKTGISLGRKFVKIANEHHIKPVQLATLWVKDQPGVTLPLIGPRTIQQLEDYLPVMEMELSQTVREACDDLVAPGSAAVNFHNSAPWMKMRLEW